MFSWWHVPWFWHDDSSLQTDACFNIVWPSKQENISHYCSHSTWPFSVFPLILSSRGFHLPPWTPPTFYNPATREVFPCQIRDKLCCKANNIVVFFLQSLALSSETFKYTQLPSSIYIPPLDPLAISPHTLLQKHCRPLVQPMIDMDFLLYRTNHKLSKKTWIGMRFCFFSFIGFSC